MSTLSRYQLPIFFVLAFGITWAVQIPAYVAAHHRGLSLTNEANVNHFADLFAGRMPDGFAPVFLLYVFSFGPTLAGIIVTALFKGREGLAMLWRRVIRVAVPGRWIALILLIPFGYVLASFVLGWLMQGLQPIEFDFLLPVSMALALLAYMILFTGLAEEIGWRGYALPELQSRYDAERSSWIIGVLWGLWHLPANFVTPWLAGELEVSLALMTLAGLTVGIVGWTIVLTWVFNNTVSVFWIIILHGLTNTLQSYLILSSNVFAANAVYIALPWIFAIYLLRRYGGEHLTVSGTARPTFESTNSAAVG